MHILRPTPVLLNQRPGVWDTLSLGQMLLPFALENLVHSRPPKSLEGSSAKYACNSRPLLPTLPTQYLHFEAHSQPLLP